MAPNNSQQDRNLWSSVNISSDRTDFQQCLEKADRALLILVLNVGPNNGSLTIFSHIEPISFSETLDIILAQREDD